MALNKQTEMAFGDEFLRRDPVSGNEVPPGALPEEVRDNIPARLSEGEYVVPADVLQYYGIKFFEDLRGKAKTDLANLENNGRMGGNPIDDSGGLPFSVEELNTYEEDVPVAANMGGVIRGYEEGGVTEMSPIGSTSSLKTYVNDEGSRLFIRFVNGVAIPPVPPGYSEEGTSSSGSETSDPLRIPPQSCHTGYIWDSIKGICVPDISNQDDESDWAPKFLRDLDKMNAAQLAQYAAEISKTGIYKTISKSGIAQLLGIGRQEKKVIGYIEEKLKIVPKGSSMANFYQYLLDGIESGDRKGLEALVKEIKTNNPELVTSVLVESGIKTKDKTSTYFDTITSSNNTIGLGGTKYGVNLGAGQLDAAISGGTAPPLDYEVGEEDGLGSEPTAPYVGRDVYGLGKMGEYGGLGAPPPVADPRGPDQIPRTVLNQPSMDVNFDPTRVQPTAGPITDATRDRMRNEGVLGKGEGLGTAPVVDTSVYFNDELDPGRNAGIDYGGLDAALAERDAALAERDAANMTPEQAAQYYGYDPRLNSPRLLDAYQRGDDLGTAPTAPRDYVVNDAASAPTGMDTAQAAQYYDPTVPSVGYISRPKGLNDLDTETQNIQLLTDLNKNPENAEAILSKGIPTIVSAQDSAVLASNLINPRLGYESGQDALQERLVKGLYGDRLPLTDSQTLAKNDAALEESRKRAEKALEESRKRAEENDKYIASLVADIEKIRRDAREEEEAAEAGGYKTVETYKNIAGGRYMNKGGLASKRKKRKK